MTVRALSLVTLGERAERVSAELERIRSNITVYRRCQELSEALGLAQAGRADIFLTSLADAADDGVELDRSLEHRLADAGCVLVILDDGVEFEDAARLGFATVSGDRDVHEIEALLLSLYAATTQEWEKRASGGAPADGNVRASGREPGPGEQGDTPLSYEGIDLKLGENTGSLADVDTPGGGFEFGGAPEQVKRADREGEVFTVWGPLGSPGVTTVAINLAAEKVIDGHSVMLIDANTYNASVAGALGLLDESAGIGQACKMADQGLLDQRALASLAVTIAVRGHRMSVLTGLSRSSRWMELRERSLIEVVQVAKTMVDVVVVDTAFCLEAPGDVFDDLGAPKRNASTRAMIELADEVVAVGNADSIGVPRLMASLDALHELNMNGVTKIIFNKMRASALGHDPQSALEDAWQRYSGFGAITGFLPYDRAGVDAALLAGQALVECAPRAPLRVALRDIFGSGKTPEGSRLADRTRRKVKFGARRARLKGEGTQRGVSLE